MAADKGKELLDKQKVLAEQGNAIAQFNLGEFYAKGLGVEKDPKEALKLFQKSAESGFVRAQSRLGMVYHFGLGVEKDPKEALNWYRKAAAQGDEWSQKVLKQIDAPANPQTPVVTPIIQANRGGRTTWQYCKVTFGVSRFNISDLYVSWRVHLPDETEPLKYFWRWDGNEAKTNPNYMAEHDAKFVLPFLRTLKQLGVKGKLMETWSNPASFKDVRTNSLKPHILMNWLGQLGWECFRIERGEKEANNFDYTHTYFFKRPVTD